MLTKAALLDRTFDDQPLTLNSSRVKPLIDDDEYSFIPDSLERWHDRAFREHHQHS